MAESVISNFYSNDRTRKVTIAVNEGVYYVYFYENDNLINTIRNPRDILKAEALAEDYTLGFLNPQLIIG